MTHYEVGFDIETTLAMKDVSEFLKSLACDKKIKPYTTITQLPIRAKFQSYLLKPTLLSIKIC